MYVVSIQVLLGTIFLAEGISAQSANDIFLSIINCVAQSEDQVLCDDFLECNTKLAQPFVVADANCTETFTPEGPGKCTKGQELYRNEATRLILNECVMSLITEKLTDEQEEEMKTYMECVKDVGGRCLK
ncbi:hypothetical protein TNIN_282091 [Trichonephila inaurata madagascariensis]|uniref:Secreted protein n=1 Tax=Trichonephila inaurata madagascariensis TaxID=2747483 RepID=A0A8X6XEJ8_9ARAC|nr:hypothetical protein TNIN_282091 [Trichonephila inaurata madagascariensis]